MLSDAVDLWSLDEVHFQQHGSRCRMWVPPECKHPVVLQHPTRKSVGYFGALRLRDGKFSYLREEKVFNAETFWTFMKNLRQVSCHSARQAVILIDNARYHHASLHTAWREKCASRFSLLFLPPYSPELNPIERVWKLTRRLATHNQYFERIEQVSEAVESVFSAWRRPNPTLKKLCAII
ncbi:MAG: IS630 family transposase [Desulfobacterales bacterium]